jgi:hypothetical protein
MLSFKTLSREVFRGGKADSEDSSEGREISFVAANALIQTTVLGA